MAPAEVATVQSLLSLRMLDTGGINVACEGQATHQRKMITPGEQEAPAQGSGANFADVPRRRSFKPFQGSNGKAVQAGAKQMKRAGPDSPGTSLADFLRELSVFDDACVLSLRKISGLGLNSADLLGPYLSKFGTVSRLMISHTRVKSKVPGVGSTRLRPAALGFAVMSSSEAVNNVLGFGAMHLV